MGFVCGCDAEVVFFRQFGQADAGSCTADAEQPGDTQGAAGSAQGHRHGAQIQHSQQSWWHQKPSDQKVGNVDLQLQCPAWWHKEGLQITD